MFRTVVIFIITILFASYSYASETKNKIEINGNERISKETIIIYGNIKQGETLNEAQINEILKNLYETNFFEDVKIKVENNILKIDVKEYL